MQALFLPFRGLLSYISVHLFVQSKKSGALTNCEPTTNAKADFEAVDNKRLQFRVNVSVSAYDIFSLKLYIILISLVTTHFGIIITSIGLFLPQTHRTMRCKSICTIFQLVGDLHFKCRYQSLESQPTRHVQNIVYLSVVQ